MPGVAFASVSWLLFAYSAKLATSARVTYSGSGNVALNGATTYTSKDWELRYQLPAVGDGGSYDIEINIDIVATSSEADLVVAVGDGQRFFAASIAYDGTICTQYPASCGSLLVTPRDINGVWPLWSGALDGKDAQDWRNTLVNHNAISEWQVSDGSTTNDMAGNISPLVIKIESSDDQTTVFYTKGSVTRQAGVYSKTFSAGLTPYLYITPDAIAYGTNEAFVIRDIQVTQQTTTPAPVPPQFGGQCAPDLETYLDQCYCGAGMRLDSESNSYYNLAIKDEDMTPVAVDKVESMMRDVKLHMMGLVLLFVTANGMFWKMYGQKRLSWGKPKKFADEEKALLVQ